MNLHLGDCLKILPDLPENSVDAVVTDPPRIELLEEYFRFAQQRLTELELP